MGGVAALSGHAEAIQQIAIPEDRPLYRGSLSHPEDHLLRYSFVVEKTKRRKTRYEVGFSYVAYRVALHQAALPLAALLVGTTAFIVVVFRYFFRVGLVAPLGRLLEGVDRVEQGKLRGDIPVLMEDEIGRLTRAFNHMVTSLQTSEEDLRALNVTLEQRVMDRTRDLATLYEIASLVSQSSPLDDLLSAVLARVVDGTHAAAGIVLVTDAEDGRLRPTAAHQIRASALLQGGQLPCVGYGVLAGRNPPHPRSGLRSARGIAFSPPKLMALTPFPIAPWSVCPSLTEGHSGRPDRLRRPALFVQCGGSGDTGERC